MPLERPPETVGFGAGFDNVGSIRNAVKQRFAKPGVGNHLCPFRERQVRCEDHSGSFRPLGNDLEQKLSSHFSQRNIAHFVDCDQIVTAPAGHHAPQLQLVFRFNQFIHQRSRSRETDAPFLPASGDAQPGEKMSFPSPARARNIMPMDPSSSGFTINFTR